MNIIVAVDNNWAIGNKGNLLCHLSGDLKYFKSVTMGYPVIMGRSTLESLPGRKGLPGRENIVLTRNKNFKTPGISRIYSSLEDLLEDKDKYSDAFVIGGAKVYDQMLPHCDTFYVTKIDGEFEADRHIKNLDLDKSLKITYESEKMEENGIFYRFVKYERK